MKFKLLFIFSFLLLFSCKKENATEVNADYIGMWSGQDTVAFYTIEINPNGEGEYQRVAPGKNPDDNIFEIGKTKVWKKNLKIGKKKFAIKQIPILKKDVFGNQLYQMKLNDVTYIRYL